MSHLPLFEKPKRKPLSRVERTYEEVVEQKKPPRKSSSTAPQTGSTAKKRKSPTASTARKQAERLKDRRSLGDWVRRSGSIIRFMSRHGLQTVIGVLFVITVVVVIRALNQPRGLPTLFTPEVRYWQSQILDWGTQYSVDPNVIATIMQIESCGYPGAASSVGAQGLFQVMPFNFESTVNNQLDPNENAKAGLKVIGDCLRYADNDVGLALACYNGGPSLISRPMSQWPQESQRYYAWGTGIYADAVRRASSSDTLNQWLNAGGAGLCQQASITLGLSTRTPNLPTPIPLPSSLPTFSAAQPIIPPTTTPFKLILTPSGS